MFKIDKIMKGKRRTLSIVAHPDDFEDYNEWFFDNKRGTALHFASLYTTLMRLRGIPSRVVIGYLGGEGAEDKSMRMVKNLMLHAWSEILIPIKEIKSIFSFIPNLESNLVFVVIQPFLN